MSEFAYPLGGAQNYTAAQAGAFNGTRTSGVWSGENNLKVTITGARQLTLSKGLAWFTTDDYWGKVYVNTDDINFTLPVADGVLDRICRLAVRWNKTTNVAAAVLLQGDLSSVPVAPSRSATDELYDLVLYDYLVAHGETEASAANLTDQRLDEDLCGLMRDGVTRIPTESLQAQVEALLEELEYDLAQVIAGSIPAHKSTHQTNGADAIAPSDIGAASATHASAHASGGADAIAPSDIGAMPTSGGTFTGAVTHNGNLVLGSACYGTTLPAAGTPGRVFFKKV